MNLTQKQRQYLRKLAHDLKPVVQIGKNGLSEQTVVSADQVLHTQELIKVKFHDFQDQKQEISEQLATRTKAVLVSIIGNTAILYRQSSDSERRTIEVPRL
ncbi:MAG: ribosome assembly RNA-binding protein YhbY [Roseiflexaceae bacterium]|nr:ribosome assembly RNA-binding protein YhbY [Roseiflexaceae bacterium]